MSQNIRTSKWHHQSSQSLDLYMKQLINAQDQQTDITIFAQEYLNNNQLLEKDIQFVKNGGEQQQKIKLIAEAQTKFQNIEKQLNSLDKTIILTYIEGNNLNFIKNEMLQVLKNYIELYNSTLTSLKSQAQSKDNNKSDVNIDSKTSQLKYIQFSDSSINQMIKHIENALVNITQLNEINIQETPSLKKIANNLNTNIQILLDCNPTLDFGIKSLSNKKQQIMANIINVLQVDRYFSQSIKHNNKTLDSLVKISRQQQELKKLDEEIDENEKQYKTTLINMNNMKQTVVRSSLKNTENDYLKRQPKKTKIKEQKRIDSEILNQNPNQYVFFQRKLSKKDTYIYTIWFIMIIVVGLVKLW